MLTKLILDVSNKYPIASKEPFKGHPVAKILRKVIPNYIEGLLLNNEIAKAWKVKGTAGGLPENPYFKKAFSWTKSKPCSMIISRTGTSALRRRTSRNAGAAR